MAEREQPVGVREIARLYDVDERTVRLWIEAGCPHRARSGRMVLVVSEVVRWRRDQDKKEHRESQSPDESKERARKLRADADLAEIKLRERRGELVSVTDAERAAERLCAIVRARVLSIRGRWAPRVLGLGTMAEATATLDALANDVLAALSDGADEMEGEDENPNEEVA